LVLKQSRGWRIVQFGWLKAPPEALSAAVYVFAFVLIIYIICMIGLGLIAFSKLGFDVAFGNFGSPLQIRGEGSSGGSLLITVFFTVLVALIGGPIAIWRVVTAHVQAQAARHQADIAQEGHYTDLFTKAVEQLGATREVKRYVQAEGDNVGKSELVTVTEPNLEVRLGAIYALDRIARDSQRDHWPIMEVLCAYVRNPQNCGELADWPASAKVDREFRSWVGEPRVDIQAALIVIGQRPPDSVVFETERSLRLNLSRANLRGAKLLSGKLARADLTGAHLEGAKLNGAHLEGAMLNEAHLEGAWLAGAHLEGAELSGADLSKVAGLDPNELASAIGDETTTLPEGMQRPASWIKTRTAKPDSTPADSGLAAAPE